MQLGLNQKVNLNKQSYQKTIPIESLCNISY